jgi:hypothetical protein
MPDVRCQMQIAKCEMRNAKCESENEGNVMCEVRENASGVQPNLRRQQHDSQRQWTCLDLPKIEDRLKKQNANGQTSAGLAKVRL